MQRGLDAHRARKVSLTFVEEATPFNPDLTPKVGGGA
jgi:hypothetical protein